MFGPSNADLLRAITGVHSEIIQERATASTRHQQYMIELDRLGDRLKKQLDRIELRVLRIEHGLHRPGRLSIVVTGETDMKLQFGVQLPKTPPMPNDIDHGELSGTINGVAFEPIVVDIADDQADQDAPAIVVNDPRLVGPDNAAVHVEYAFVDDAGNKSEPSVFDVTLLDTVAPSAPGQLGIATVEEVPDDEAADGGN